MKKIKNLLLLLIPLGLLWGAGSARLARSPLDLFLLKGADNNIEAYHLKWYLNGREPSVENLPLSAGQKQEGLELLKQKDKIKLISFSKNFGSYEIIIGFPTSEEGWPVYLGGGWRALWMSPGPESFDNLQWVDRLYLSLRSTPPPVASLEVPLEDPTKTKGVTLETNPAASSTPIPTASTGTLRVEILNGCGIKGAADWAARRLKGPGIVITDTGNAENFHFAKSTVKTAAGIPVALEEAVERLGLTKASIEESTDSAAAVDVVVIVGRDYRQLRERVRERN